MGTSSSNKGGSGGAWTGFKRSATDFAKYGGRQRAAKALAGYVAAMGGAAAAAAATAAGSRTGQSLGNFLSASTGPNGLADGLESVGLSHLIGQDRYTVLSELLNAFAGDGGDIETQAARNALLDVLDDLLPQEEGTELNSVHLDEQAVTESLCRYLDALIYNLAIPIIDERLTRLENPALAQERDRELRDYIDALVRLRIQDASPLQTDWHGSEGQKFISDILRAVYDQLEEWE